MDAHPNHWKPVLDGTPQPPATSHKYVNEQERQQRNEIDFTYILQPVDFFVQPERNPAELLSTSVLREERGGLRPDTKIQSQDSVHPPADVKHHWKILEDLFFCSLKTQAKQ